MQFKKSPHHLLVVTGLVLVLISFFLNEKQTFDIHLHDTYFIIVLGHVFWLFAIIVAFLWTLYLVSRKVLYSTRLTWLHVVMTVMTVLLILFLVYLQGNISNQSSGTYLDFNYLRALDRNRRFIAYSSIVLILVQITFLINF